LKDFGEKYFEHQFPQLYPYRDCLYGPSLKSNPHWSLVIRERERELIWEQEPETCLRREVMLCVETEINKYLAFQSHLIRHLPMLSKHFENVN
jgi:hypothetical protein